jgi:outer membrane protein TolC
MSPRAQVNSGRRRELGVAITPILPRGKRLLFILRMRPLLTLSLALLAVGALRAEAPALDGTMPEDQLPGLAPLLKEAVDRSPTTIMSSISLAAAEANVYLNEAALWPTVSGYAQEQESIESETGTKASRSSALLYGASLSQPLFQWGAYKNQAMIGKLGRTVAERNFAETYRTLAVAIREQYFALIGKKILLRNSQFNLKLSKESQAAQQARFEAGATSQAELTNFRMTTEQAQLDLDRAQEDYNYSKQVFLRLVGIDSLDEDTIPLELPHPEVNAPKADAVLTGFVGGGIESTFQNDVFRMYVQEQDLSYRIARVRLLPKFSANAAFNVSNNVQPSAGGVTQYKVESETYNVAANWTIFDGFATRGSKLAALANKRLYERQRQNYVDSTVDQISNMRHQLGFSARSLSLVEVRTALLGAQVKRLNQDVGLGYASEASRDAGILDLYATEYQQAFARTDFWSRWTEFVSLAGDDPALANISARYVR